MNYKKYRIFLSTTTASFFVAASNTVNDLVDLTKIWFQNPSAGLYIPDNAQGFVELQELNETPGSYIRGERRPFVSKKDVITQVRALGGR